MDDAHVGQRRLCQDDRNVAVRKLALQRIDVVELDDARGLRRIHGRAEIAAPRPDDAVRERRERLVDRAVVAPVEDEHLGAPGEMSCEPDREAVRVGCGECELPGGDAEPPRQLRRDHERVLGRKHERDASRRLLLDRLQRGLRERARSSRPCPRGRSRRTRSRRRPRTARHVASRTKTGKPPGHFRIQCIGTPSKSVSRACSANARERGCDSTNRASSRACSSDRAGATTPCR